MAGMLQDSLQNKTVLKQLDQTVVIHLSKSLEISRSIVVDSFYEVLPPARVTETMSSSDKEYFPILERQGALKQVIFKGDTQKLGLLKPIEANQIGFLTEQVGTDIILPVRKIEKGTPDWIVGLAVLVLVLLATVRLFFHNYFRQLFRSAFSFSSASRMFREKSLSITHASFRIDIIFFLIFSLFLFQVGQTFQIDFRLSGIIEYLIFLGGVLTFFMIKRFLYLVQGGLSKSIPETSEFLFNMNNYNRILGLLLFPVCMVIAFTPLAEADLVILAGFVLVGVIYILLILRGIKILMRKHFSIFYLILYLCTLEILPLLLGYKVMKSLILSY